MALFVALPPQQHSRTSNLTRLGIDNDLSSSPPHGSKKQAALQFIQSARRYQQGIIMRVRSSTPDLTIDCSTQQDKHSAADRSTDGSSAASSNLRTHVRVASNTIGAWFDHKYRQACDRQGHNSKTTHLQLPLKDYKRGSSGSAARRVSGQRRAAREDGISEPEDCTTDDKPSELPPGWGLKCLFGNDDCDVCRNNNGAIPYFNHYAKVVAHLFRSLKPVCCRCKRPVETLSENRKQHIECTPSDMMPFDYGRRWPRRLQPDPLTIAALAGDIPHPEGHKQGHRVGKQGQRWINAWLYARDFYRSMGEEWPLTCPSPYVQLRNIILSPSLAPTDVPNMGSAPVFAPSAQSSLFLSPYQARDRSPTGWTSMTPSSLMEDSSELSQHPMSYQHEVFDTPEAHSATGGDVESVWLDTRSAYANSAQVSQQSSFSPILGQAHSGSGVEFAGGVGSLAQGQPMYSIRQTLPAALPAQAFPQYGVQPGSTQYAARTINDQDSDRLGGVEPLVDFDEFSAQFSAGNYNYQSRGA